MDTKGYKMGENLLVCGLLLASVMLISLYSLCKGPRNPIPAERTSAGLAKDGYGTTALRRIGLDGTKDKAPSGVADWQVNVPGLQKKVSLHLAGADPSRAITALAKMSGLNFACVDLSGHARITLYMTHVPVWQVMQAMASSCGGSWQRVHGLFTLRLPPTP